MSVEKTHKLVTVVCACIRREGGQQVLLSVRHAPGVAGLDGKWELPGGKIEFGETPEHALVREIHEEIGIQIHPSRLLPYLHTNVWEYEHTIQQVVLAGYECQLKPGSEPLENEDVRWFDVEGIDFSTTLPGTREFIGLALRNEWFDKLCIRLESIDPVANVTKHFVIAAQPTLFSQYGLVKYWGTVGRYTRLRHEEFDSPKEMDQRIFDIIKIRLSDGYRITALEGPGQRYEVLGKIVNLARGQHAIAEDVWVN
jgi:8-oxo-dGTP diphosphatase